MAIFTRHKTRGWGRKGLAPCENFCPKKSHSYDSWILSSILTKTVRNMSKSWHYSFDAGIFIFVLMVFSCLCKHIYCRHCHIYIIGLFLSMQTHSLPIFSYLYHWSLIVYTNTFIAGIFIFICMYMYFIHNRSLRVYRKTFITDIFIFISSVSSCLYKHIY